METGSALIAALLASAQDATWVVNRDLAITYFNEAFSRLASGSFGGVPRAGIALDKLIDSSRDTAVHDLWLDLFRQALSGSSVAGDTRLVVDGAQRSYRITGVPIIEEGSVSGAAFTAHDLTDAPGRAHAELLRLIERKSLEWTLTFDAIELPIFITSMDGVIRRLNRAGRDLAGTTDYSDVLGRRATSIGHDEPWTTFAQCVESVRDSEQPCNAQAYHAGSDRSWDIAANWYRNPDDQSARAIVALRETTVIVRLQDAVRRGEQLAALGELVAGVAHEVKNPIFGMQLTVDALESLLPPEKEVADLVVVLRRWLDRLNRLMESLLAYGRTWSLDLHEGDLAGVVAMALQTVQPAADSTEVVLITQTDRQLSMLMDASRLTQAFENLLTNAIQHSVPQQSVTITARTQGGFIECTVCDEGPGFTPGDLPRVFEPFFTRRRGGTGLGLSIVQRIVEEHGGTIRAANAPHGGALITVLFPVYPSSAGPAQHNELEQ
jgi:signal transduction histidine kinase